MRAFRIISDRAKINLIFRIHVAHVSIFCGKNRGKPDTGQKILPKTKPFSSRAYIDHL